MTLKDIKIAQKRFKNNWQINIFSKFFLNKKKITYNE
jgi:hypothetical protein